MHDCHVLPGRPPLPLLGLMVVSHRSIHLFPKILLTSVVFLISNNLLKLILVVLNNYK